MDLLRGVRGRHRVESNLFLLCLRYDTYKLQRLQQKKLDRQEAMMEKEMFVGKRTSCFV